MKHLRIFAILMAAILMVSCNKDDNQATGVGDAIIVVKQSGTNTVYGISLYAYTLSSFASVTTVSAAEPGKTYTLKSNEGYKTSFYYETPDAEFNTTKPAATTYTFSATFENGIQQTFQNSLSDKVLPIPTFVKCDYDILKHWLDISWAAIDNVSGFSVNIYDDKTLIFATPELKSTVSNCTVSVSGQGWLAGHTPVAGKTYIVRLYAYLYEPNGGAYNVQSISIAEKQVVWGD